MKYLVYLISICFMVSCGNKKEQIVEEIKKTKNERAEAQMNQGNYSTAAKHLYQYNIAMAEQKDVYKDAFENDKKRLQGESVEVLSDHRKLDSIAIIWEWKSKDAQRKIDSLELELKKY